MKQPKSRFRLEDLLLKQCDRKQDPQWKDCYFYVGVDARDWTNLDKTMKSAFYYEGVK